MVALCRSCADEPELDEQGASSITCVCGEPIEVYRATTSVVDGAIVALCASCARDGVEPTARPVLVSSESDSAPAIGAEPEVSAPVESLRPRRRRSSGYLIAAAAVAVAVAVAVVVAMRTSSGATTRHDDRAPVQPPGLVTSVAPALHIEHEVPPTTTMDEPEPATAPEDAELSERSGVIVPIMLRNGGDTAKFVIPVDGKVDAAAAKTIAAFLGCRQTNTHRALAPQLLAMLADLADHFEGHTIEVISAYRATSGEPKTSPHIEARAADLRVVGVSLEAVRDYIWANHRAVGLGYYPHSEMLHVDYRPARERIAWTQSRMGAANHYHPPWSQPRRAKPDTGEPTGADRASKQSMENM